MHILKLCYKILKKLTRYTVG